MQKTDRSHLPFRKNTEGYFLDKNNNILAQVSKEGYLLFPGGGIEESETPEQGLIRETFEETGAMLEEPLKELGKLKIVWDSNWAKTGKQKKRYEQYQGDEMYFFFGRIKEFKQQQDHEDAWQGEKFIPLQKAIKILEENRDKNEYREKQVQYLKEIENKQKPNKKIYENQEEIHDRIYDFIKSMLPKEVTEAYLWGSVVERKFGVRDGSDIDVIVMIPKAKIPSSWKFLNTEKEWWRLYRSGRIEINGTVHLADLLVVKEGKEEYTRNRIK